MTFDPTQDRIVIDPSAVAEIFKKLRIRKASWPDGISALLLKIFADELTPAWSPLFLRSVDTCTIPTICKKAVIIPGPKNLAHRNVIILHLDH